MAPDPPDRSVHSLSPNQVVALNISSLRQARGWTQADACERLAPLMGARWSPAVLSAAERSAFTERTREFSADELVAFARLFGVPLNALLALPEGGPYVMRTPDGSLTAHQAAETLAGSTPVSVRAEAQRLVFQLLRALDDSGRSANEEDVSAT